MISMTMYACFAIRSHIQGDTYRKEVSVKMKDTQINSNNRMANSVVAC